MPNFFEMMFGSPAQKGSTYNKGQLSAIDQILSQIKNMSGQQDITQNENYQTGQNWLQSMFSDPSFFEKFEAPIKRDFEENVIPNLANRFSSQGSGGSLGSTGFRNQLAREGSNLSTNLAAMRGQMQQNAIPQLMNFANQPFQNLLQMQSQALQPTQNTYQGPSAGFLGPILASLFGGGAMGFGNKLGQMFAGQSQSTM